MVRGNEVLVIPSVMVNEEIREALRTLSRPMTTQVNRDTGPSVNIMEITNDLTIEELCEDESSYIYWF